MSNLEASFSILGQKGVMAYILKGTVFTLIIALIAVVLGIVIGSVLALCRNYCTSKKTKIFGMIATVYIEVFRNTPLLLWIFICLVFCPCPELFNRKLFGLTTVETKLLFKAAVALILFTSSVIAEIIRGGLNSIAHGQFEAGHYILLYDYDDTGFCVKDPNRVSNSSRTWDYDTLSPQIKNLWTISPTGF